MPSWPETNRRIIDALDLAAEFRSLGLDIVGEPGPDGWASCRCLGREDRNPSAGVNLVGEHPIRGRYKEFTGEARNLSFFEFAAAAGKFPDWQAARAHYRKLHEIPAPRGRGGRSLEDQFRFQDYNERLMRLWCSHRPPIEPWAVRFAGGQNATWMFGGKPIPVVVLPVYGEHGTNDTPCGYVYWALNGDRLPVSQGPGKPVLWVKMKTAKGSGSGLMNRYALNVIDRAEVAWKVEGPADMLALQSVIPRDLLGRHAVVTNSGGTLENPKPWELAPFAGKKVFVCHDRDRDGQAGGLKWAAAIATVAKEVRNVELSYPLEESHGKDVRDFLREKMEAA